MAETLLFVAALCAGMWGNAFAQRGAAVMHILPEDQVMVTLKKNASNHVVGVLSPRADVLEYVEGSLLCWGDLPTCVFDTVLKLDGPVEFTGLDVSSISAGFAKVVRGQPSIDFKRWGSRHYHIAEVETLPSATIDPPGPFSTRKQSASSVSSRFMGARPSNLTVTTRLFTQPVCRGCVESYQNVQFVSLARPIDATLEPLTVWERKPGLGDAYQAVEGNRGVVSGGSAGPQGENYRLTVSEWGTARTEGHYAAVRFFVHGTARDDAGVDMSSYASVEVLVACTAGVNVEAFVGDSAFDSSQTFIGDIRCTGDPQSLGASLAGSDLTNIQNALYLHVPLWKNSDPDLADFSVDVDRITFS